MNDLISRQDAIGKIKDWMKFIGYSHSDRNVMECTIQMLEELPSALQEQKTGRWINGLIGWNCSECTLGTNQNWFNYCPNCGARMEREEE